MMLVIARLRWSFPPSAEPQQLTSDLPVVPCAHRDEKIARLQLLCKGGDCLCRIREVADMGVVPRHLAVQLLARNAALVCLPGRGVNPVKHHGVSGTEAPAEFRKAARACVNRCGT